MPFNVDKCRIFQIVTTNQEYEYELYSVKLKNVGNTFTVHQTLIFEQRKDAADKLK